MNCTVNYSPFSVFICICWIEHGIIPFVSGPCFVAARRCAPFVFLWALARQVLLASVLFLVRALLNSCERFREVLMPQMCRKNGLLAWGAVLRMDSAVHSVLSERSSLLFGIHLENNAFLDTVGGPCFVRLHHLRCSLSTASHVWAAWNTQPRNVHCHVRGNAVGANYVS